MKTAVIFVTLIVFLLAPAKISAHCDTMDGPVVKAARTALEKGDVGPVLKWVSREHEPEIREAFAKTVVVRGRGGEARELADRWFFETLVRVHRAGEGAPYTGLKQAGSEVHPFVRAADQALEQGSPDALLKSVSADIEKEIRQRFATASEYRKSAESNVEAGRKFVEAYVRLQHYLENLPAGEAPAEVHHHP